MLDSAFRNRLNKICLKRKTFQFFRVFLKIILPLALEWKPFTYCNKRKKRKHHKTHPSLKLLSTESFFLQILFDNKIRVVIKQQVLTVV